MEHLPLFSTETLSVIGFHAISFWSELGCRCGAMHFEIVENRASFHTAALSATPAVLPRVEEVKQFCRRSVEFGRLHSVAPPRHGDFREGIYGA